MDELSKQMKSLSGIEEGDKRFLKNMDLDKEQGSEMMNEADQKKFIIIEFAQEEVEPGEDDEKLYKLK